MSFRGRMLVINLVASTLWHKLSCVDPPVGLLPKLQAILVNFSWDSSFQGTTLDTSKCSLFAQRGEWTGHGVLAK